MKVTNCPTIFATDIAGVFVVKRPDFRDKRGFFKETFRLEDLDAVAGYKFRPVQENHSRSKRGVLRGIHTAPWAKFVYVSRGEVMQVVVDFRAHSPTFMHHISLNIGERNRVKVFIPPGCGNACQVLSGQADYMYLTDDYWTAGKEYTVAWNDTELGIQWAAGHPILSEKDEVACSFQEAISKGLVK